MPDFLLPLLHALEDSAELDQHVKDAAIRQAFLKLFPNASIEQGLSVSHHDAPGEDARSDMSCYYDHSAICPKIFSALLKQIFQNSMISGNWFKWALLRADTQDLKHALRGREASHTNGLYSILRCALKHVDPARDRRQDMIKRAALAKTIFCMISKVNSSGPADIIAGYLVEAARLAEVQGMMGHGDVSRLLQAKSEPQLHPQLQKMIQQHLPSQQPSPDPIQLQPFKSSHSHHQFCPHPQQPRLQSPMHAQSQWQQPSQLPRLGPLSMTIPTVELGNILMSMHLFRLVQQPSGGYIAILPPGPSSPSQTGHGHQHTDDKSLGR